MDVEFHSLEELYNRLLPALTAKKRELYMLGYTSINIKDIWNYFRSEKWITAHNLSLYQVVDDILNTDADIINNYYIKSNCLEREWENDNL